MPRAIAIVVTDLERSRLGLPARVRHEVCGASVLSHTVARAAKVGAVRAVVLVHPVGQDVMAPLGGRKFGKPVMTFADPFGLVDRHTAMRRAARKWALSAWRGGLAGAGCYDELLPAGPLIAAMDDQKADSALLVGGDWPLVDPAISEQVLQRHLNQPLAMAFTFSQAPPGLAGVAVGRELLGEIAAKNGLFGRMLSYNPAQPQADPIGRDVCVAINHEVRGCMRRFIDDTPRSSALIDALAARLGDRFATANARTIAEAATQLDPTRFGNLPQQVTLELTPQRAVTGPITPQHYVQLNRPPMPTDAAIRLVEQMGAEQDIALTLGGLGDALLHPDVFRIIDAARNAGVLGIHVETDLLVDRPILEQLLRAPIDVVSVRLNADTAKMYETVMGGAPGDFKRVVENVQWLLSNRGESVLPWIVPRLVKTKATLADMETFFDRWTHVAGQAVIEPATTGAELMPLLAPLDMAPPRRRPCAQLDRRLTVQSDGRAALCDQDWLGRAPIGDANAAPLADIWLSMTGPRDLHRAGRWNEIEVCSRCTEWHRP